MVRELPIRAGALSARLVGDQLRDICVGGIPVLDAIYVAVRNAGWGTVPGEVVDYRDAGGGDISLVMRHVAGDIDFCWHGRIRACRNEIRFDMDGLVKADFDACRIGFCLLHPISLTGYPVTVQTAHGTLTRSFPERISPVQVFEDVTAMRYDVAPGTGISVRLEGDLFETEDHRNWTDAGWKTYCTPLRNGFPFRVHKGQSVAQGVTITAHGSARAQANTRSPAEVLVTVEDGGSLPEIGFGAAAPGRSPVDRSALIAALDPGHITVELDLAEQWPRRLELAAAEAIALGTSLDICLVTTGEDLNGVADALASAQARLGRIAIFDATTHVTPPGAATRLRESLARRGCRVRVGGGSRAAFAELNRMVLSLDEWDFVTYSISPQVHHTDDESIMNTVAAQIHTVRDARRLAAGLPLVIGPITLATRFDPQRRAEPTDVADPRQWRPFNAAWAAASITGLIGATGLTYFQTEGPHGLLPGPDGATAPLYDVFRALAPFHGARLSRVHLDRADIAALAIRHDGRHTVLVVNLRSHPRAVVIRDAARSHDIDLNGYGTALVTLPPQ